MEGIYEKGKVYMTLAVRYLLIYVLMGIAWVSFINAVLKYNNIDPLPGKLVALFFLFWPATWLYILVFNVTDFISDLIVKLGRR